MSATLERQYTEPVSPATPEEVSAQAATDTQAGSLVTPQAISTQAATHMQPGSQVTPKEAVSARAAWAHALWILGAAAFGFLASALFVGVLQWPRGWFLVPYVGGGALLVLAYIRWSGVDVLGGVRHHRLWGLVGAVAAGAFVVSNVLAQPASAAPVGLELIGALVWFGVVYGAMDALLLSILPMLAAWQALSALGWTSNWVGRVASGVLALFASLLVAAAYHFGFPEFRSAGLMAPVIGNGVMSLATLLTMSPIAAVVSHIGMHVAAVLHGLETTVQLPPHYAV